MEMDSLLHNHFEQDIDFSRELQELLKLRLEQNHPVIYEVLNINDKEVEDGRSRDRRDQVYPPPC